MLWCEISVSDVSRTSEIQYDQLLVYVVIFLSSLETVSNYFG